MAVAATTADVGDRNVSCAGGHRCTAVGAVGQQRPRDRQVCQSVAGRLRGVFGANGATALQSLAVFETPTKHEMSVAASRPRRSCAL